MGNMIRFLKNKKTWGILWVIMFLSFIFYYTTTEQTYITMEKVGKLQHSRINPKIIPIKIKKEDDTKIYSLFLITEDNLGNKKNDTPAELYDPMTYKTKLIPISNLGSATQNYVSFSNTPNKLLNLKLIKTSNDDSYGIDVYSTDTNVWKKLKTKPLPRENTMELPFYDIVYNGKTPLLLVWGGINYKTGKPQNTIEVIDILNDKLLEKKDINYTGGAFTGSLDKKCYLIGAQPIKNNNPTINNFTILSHAVQHVPFSTMYPLLFTYTRIMTGTLSSSMDERVTLAVDLKQKVLSEYKFPNNISAKIELNAIPIPDKFKKYQLVAGVQTLSKVLLIFKKSETEQTLAWLSNFENQKRNAPRLIFIKTIDSNINFKNVIYFYSEYEKVYSFLFVDGFDILKLNINKN